MADVKSIAVMVILIVFVGTFFFLVVQRINEDGENLNNIYDIRPGAGDDKEVVEGEKVTFVGRNFADATKYPDVQYKWDFGDGETPWERNVLDTATHTYDSSGEYIARFTITVIGDSGEESKSDYINVTVLKKSQKNTSPVATFTVSSDRATVGETIHFSAVESSDVEDGNNLEFSWDLDNDGIEDGTQREIFYNYSLVGEYLATLIVTDSGGKMDEHSESIYITEMERPDNITVELPNNGQGEFSATMLISDSNFIITWELTSELAEGIKKLEVILEWDELSWDLDLYTGKGADISSGETLAKDTGGNEGAGEGYVVLQLDDTGALAYDEDEGWFVEVGTKESIIAEGGDKRLNEQCEFIVTVILWYV